MSTKIYNGYRIEAQSLDKVVTSLLSLRNDATYETLTYILQKNLFSAVNLYDSLLVKDILQSAKQQAENTSESTNSKKFTPNIANSALVNAYSKHLNKFWNKDDKSEDDSNIEIKVVVFPNAVEVEGKNNYLLCLYADRQLNDWITSHWENLGVQEYGYWNNTDEPEDVSIEQWEIRKNHWDSVLTGKDKTGVPAVEGLSLTISQVNQYYYDLNAEKSQRVLKDLIEKNQDKLAVERRVTEYFEEFTISTIMNELLEQKEMNIIPEKVTNEFVQDSLNCYFEARSIVRSKEYSLEHSKLFEKTKVELINRLTYPILLEDLNQPLEKSLQKYSKADSVPPIRNKLK